MDLSVALRWSGLATTVLESHDGKASLLGITNFLDEMTYVFISSALYAPNYFCHFVLRCAFASR